MTAEDQPLTESPQLASFERLVKMIEFELELAAQGKIDDLHDAVAARTRFLSTLPHPVPPEAQHLLLRAQALHGRASIETQRLTAALARQRDAQRRAHRMARTYIAPPLPANYSTSA